MSYYLPDILVSARRVITLQDRNPLGTTAGLFSRNYWHFLTSDFPSATDQMGIAILAKLWSLDGTAYYKNPEVFSWILQGIRGLSNIQKSDGSFDEWYVNERGWAGPTGYILNAALDTYELLQHILPTEEKYILESTIKKGINFLKMSQEGHVLANHLAIVILPLVQARFFLQMETLTPVIDELIKKLQEVWNDEEGWSTEYDGADPGYQSGTLSFLMKALKYKDHPVLRRICVRSLDFISYFAFPSGAVGGGIGSRHTVTFFCAGIEAMRDTQMGARLSQFLEDGFKNKTQVLSSDLDDHYLFYRLYELLDAHFFTLKKERHSSPGHLRWEGEPFRKSFPFAGIEIGKKGDIYWVISLKRGGALRLENAHSRKTILVDNGIICSSGNKTFSSLWQGTYQIETSQNKLTVRGPLVDVSPKIFTPFKMVIFRLFSMLTGFHYRSSLWLKNIIRKIMTVNNKSSSHFFERTFVFEDEEIKITTKVHPGSPLEKLFIGGEFWSRYVPQSRHFIEQHLSDFAPYEKKSSISSPVSFSKVVRVK